jgi:hypothetical protein
MEAHVTDIATKPLEKASTVGSALPMEHSEVISAAPSRVSKTYSVFVEFLKSIGKQKPQAQKVVVYVSKDFNFTTAPPTVTEHHDLEDRIDYSGAMAVLAKARPVDDEVDPPLGRTPFGA